MRLALLVILFFAVLYLITPWVIRASCQFAWWWIVHLWIDFYKLACWR